MRIGMLVDVYKPYVSGITNYIALNKKHLEALGHEVFVFTFGEEDYPDDEPNIIRSPGLALRDTGYYVGLKYSRRAVSLLKTMDVAHVHHPFLSGSLALLHCKPRRIPVIFTNHTRYDLYAQAYLPGVPNAVGEAALQTYLPAFCRACSLIISPSPGMRDVLIQFGVDAPIEVVPNGVDLKPFRAEIQPADRHELGFTEEDVLLAYIGRLGPEKNLPFLLQAFTGVAKAYGRVGLLIVGDGPERAALEEMARETGLEKRVKFTGLIPYAELPRYLKAADAFVTASVTEVHPLSVLEAMASGLPVLGICSPGVGDIVVDGANGYLAEAVDMATFTAKLVRMATYAEERQRLGQEAYRSADAYAIERTTLRMQECYEKVRAESKRRKKSTLSQTLDDIKEGWLE